MKLPVLATVADAWRELIHDWPVLLRVAWIPFALQALGQAFFVYADDPLPAEGPPELGRVLRYFAYEFAFWLALVPAVTAWHRHVIAGPGGPPAAYAVGAPELRYLGKVLLVGVLIALLATALMIPIMVPIALLAESREQAGELGAGLGSMVGGFVAPIVLLHGLLLLPAAAIGRDLRLGEARAMLRGSRWRLLAVLLLAYVPALIATLLLRAVLAALAGEPSPHARFVLHLADTLVQYGFLAVTVGALSFSYLRLAERGG